MALNGDLEAAVQMLAADNAWLCDIALAADKMTSGIKDAEYRFACGEFCMRTLLARIDAAMDAFKVVRNGH